MSAVSCESLKNTLPSHIKCEQVPLRYGDKGTDDTVQDMLTYSRRDANNPFVKKIASELKGKTDFETVKNIFRYVRKRFPYKSDPKEVEFFTAAIHHLTGAFKKYCDCDDLTGILVTLFKASGLQSAIKVISWRNEYLTHVYALVDIPSLKISIPIDATVRELGKEKYQPIRRSKLYWV